MHAAVEQDAHQGDGDHPFHRQLRRRVQGRAGMIWTAIAAPARTSAGEGIFTRSVSRFDSTATSPAAAVTSTTRANGSVSDTTALLRVRHGYVNTDQASRRTTNSTQRSRTSAGCRGMFRRARPGAGLGGHRRPPGGGNRTGVAPGTRGPVLIM